MECRKVVPYRAATDPHKVIPATQFSRFFHVERPEIEKKYRGSSKNSFEFS